MDNSTTPGPGAHALGAAPHAGPEHTFGGLNILRQPTQSLGTSADVPGPGQYPVHPPRRGPAFTVGGAHREHGSAFLLDNSTTPGPGAHPLGAAPHGGPEHTFGGLNIQRQPYDTNSGVPGPGHYPTHQPHRGPEYSLGSRYQLRDEPEHHLGPGVYDVPPAMPSGNAYTFGGSRRSAFTQDDDDAPGVGWYDVDSGPSGPAFTMSQRLPSNAINYDNDVPPVGWYDPTAHLHPSGPAYSIATRLPGQSNAAEADSGVTPGRYDVASRETGLSFSIGVRLPSQTGDKHNSVPTPGRYELPAPPRGPAFTMSMRTDPQEPKRKQRKVAKKTSSHTPSAHYDVAHRTTTHAMPSRRFGTPFEFGKALSFNLPPKAPLIAWRGDSATSLPDQEKFITGPQTPEKMESAAEETTAVRAGEGPAFSFGPPPAIQLKRDGFLKAQAGCGPGPGAYDVDELQTRKNSAPAYSMGAKPETRQQAKDEIGPGAYHDPDHTSLGGPAFSIAGRPEPKTATKDDLGPGAYYDPESTTFGGPAFTLAGRPGRGVLDADGSDMPGPGAYTRDGDEKSGRAFTFGRRVQRHDENKSEAPPPGAYEVAESKKGPAFSMGGRPAEKAKSADADAEPGPGEYYQPDPASRGPAFSMPGRAPSKKPVDLGPGPGAYYGEDVRTGPAYSIAGRPEEKPMAKDGLGPGAYHDPDHTSLGGPAFSIAGRPEPKTATKDDLGPGAYYDPESTTFGGPAFTLAGRPGRGVLDADGSDMPGPGAYTRDGDEKSGRAFTFGRRVQRHDENKSEAPPPGAYEVAESKKGPAFSMGGRPAEKAKSADADAEPGPGEYYQPDPASRGPAFSMPGRAPSKKPVDLGPGPGAYYGEDVRTGPAYSIAGRPEEKPMAKDGLGPGAYHDPDHTSLGGPAYTIPGRPHEKPEAVQTPGPADYDHVEPSGPAFTMPGRPPKPEQLDDRGYYDLPLEKGLAFTMYPRIGKLITPGDGDGPALGQDSPHPMTYKLPDLPAGPRFTMASAGRKDVDGGKVPGPGEYDGGWVGRWAPEYTMSGKAAHSKSETTPGPGEYVEPPQPRRGPIFLYEERGSKIPDGPGPGDYEMPTKRDKAYTIGVKGTTRPPKPGPGPGQYHQPDAPHGPAASFTFAPRAPDEKPDEKPGPGAYDATNKGPQGNHYTFGRRAAVASRGEPLTPGPGGYAPPEADPGPAFTFAGRPMTKAQMDTPAPGDYHPETPAAPASRGVETVTEKLSGFHFTFTARRREQLAAQTPAPGDYEFVAPRSAPAPSPTPRGPTSALRRGAVGTRQGGVTFFGGDAPSYTLGGKTGSGAMGGGGSGTPAPGDYASTSSTSGKGAGPSYSMPRASASSEPYPRTGDAPGPGKYKPKAVSKGPSYTMGGGGAGFEGAKPETPLVGGTAAPPAPVGPSFTLGRRLPDE